MRWSGTPFEACGVFAREAHKGTSVNRLTIDSNQLNTGGQLIADEGDQGSGIGALVGTDEGELEIGERNSANERVPAAGGNGGTENDGVLPTRGKNFPSSQEGIEGIRNRRPAGNYRMPVRKARLEVMGGRPVARKKELPVKHSRPSVTLERMQEVASGLRQLEIDR
jgi:hypothetical protein